MSERISKDGFLLDEWGQEWVYCNACGEEARVGDDCCDDGEIVAVDA